MDGKLSAPKEEGGMKLATLLLAFSRLCSLRSISMCNGTPNSDVDVGGHRLLNHSEGGKEEL